MKLDAELNVKLIDVTLAVFHFEMSALNVGLLANRLFMSVTAPTSQSPIGPYSVAAVVGLVVQSVTAVPMLALSIGVTLKAPGESTSRSAATAQRAVTCNRWRGWARRRLRQWSSKEINTERFPAPGSAFGGRRRTC